MSIIFAMLLTGGSILTAEAQSSSVPDSYDLASPSVESLDDLIASSSGSFEPAGIDVDTNLVGFEPHVAVNPLNPANVAVGQGARLVLSTDSGATFPITVIAQLPPALVPLGYVFCGDSVVTFDSQGRLFWTYLTCDFDMFGTRIDLSVTVMQVNPITGAVVGNAVDVTPGLFDDDKPWIAADANPLSPFVDNLYLVWVRFGETTPVLYSMSTDQGVTWTPPQAISTVAEGFTWPPHIAVAPNGDVYANYPTNTCGGTGTIQVLRDTNGGTDLAAGNPVQKTAAFTSQQATVSCNVQSIIDAFGIFAPIPQTLFWLQGSAAAYTIADPLTAGRIYVVGNDDPNNTFGNGDDGDVVMATSTDFGNTWAVKTITSGPANSLQVMPTPAIDELGNICVSWYDTRNGLTNGNNNWLLDVFTTFSTDGGVTFSPDLQINDAAFDPDLNAPARFPGPPVPTLRIGEYNGIDAANGLASAAWTGNDAINNNQDIFFDTFPCKDVIIVGGELLPIDTTALMLAGLQSSAVWILPVLAGAAGASAFFIRRK